MRPSIPNKKFVEFVIALQALERKAHDLTLNVTGLAINKAVQAAGWEQAERKNPSSPYSPRSTRRRTCARKGISREYMG